MNSPNKSISNLIIVNGVALPTPCRDLEIIRSQAVDSARNASGAVVGQKVGRKMWKINNLHWTGLNQQQWNLIQNALEPFFVDVTFTGDDGQRHTITMYHGDTNAKPYHVTGVSYDFYENCSFNLIDCGWKEK